MKQNFKELLRKCQFPLMIAFGTMPIVLILFAAVSSRLLPFAWVFPTVYVVLTILNLRIPGKRRLPFGLGSVLLFAALGALAMVREFSLFLLLAPAMYSILLLWSLKIAGWSANEEIPSFWYWFGALIHILAQVVRFFARAYEYSALEPANPWMIASFFLFAMLVLLSMTRSSLSSASGTQQSASVTMRRKNTLMTLGFFVAALLIALLPSVITAVKAFWSWLAGLLARLFDSPPGSSSPVAAIPPETGGAPAIAPENSEPSLFIQILNAIFYVAAHVITIGVLAYLTYLLLRGLIKLSRRLWLKLSRYASTISEDYADEITDTRESGIADRHRATRKKYRLSAVDEGALSPGARIRRRYLRLLLKHTQWTADSTARENLPAELACLYERARYSEHPISEEEAAQFSAGTRRI